MGLPAKPKYLEVLLGAVSGAALMICWILPSAAALAENQPGLFQRLGAMGIIWAILVFTFERRRIAHIEDIAYDPKSRAEVEDLSSHFSKVSSELSEIESKLELLKEIDGLEDNPSVIKLADLKALEQEKRAYVSKSQATLVEGSLLIPRARRIVIGVTWFEVTVVLLATIQSGFGDWFVCSVNDGSLSTC